MDIHVVDSNLAWSLGIEARSASRLETSIIRYYRSNACIANNELLGLINTLDAPHGKSIYVEGLRMAVIINPILLLN